VADDNRIAFAVVDGRLLRTVNGGTFWDEIPLAAKAYAATADLASGGLYVATDTGVWFAMTDLRAAGAIGGWARLSGLPTGRAVDVRLDGGANQVFVAMEGHGIFRALAPHRFLDPRLVNAADHTGRAAAPGSLLSMMGGKITGASAGPLAVPVLAAAASESQIQVPFEVAGTVLDLALATAAADGKTVQRNMTVPLRSASPAIFADHDGAPMILDAERAVLLDRMTPARAGTRIQILATGLGRVNPSWPTGLPAPLDNPPAVQEPVRVYLDRQPIEVVRATLAPGYIGFYLIEVQIPAVVNQGPAEVYIESAGESSARVSLYLTQ
jgi:uncharacterized protein (TIGR03437 family)